MLLDIEWSLTLKKFGLISEIGDPIKGDDFVLLLLLLLFVTSNYVKQATWLQVRPSCFHPLGEPTHRPLYAFCSCRSYIPRTLGNLLSKDMINTSMCKHAGVRAVLNSGLHSTPKVKMHTGYKGLLYTNLTLYSPASLCVSSIPFQASLPSC